MKTTIALAAVLFGSAAVSSLFAQGQLLWGNQFTGALQARVYTAGAQDPFFVQLTGNAANGLPAGTQVYTGAPLTGTGFTMGLFLGNSFAEVISATTALQTSPFRTGGAAGFVNARTYTDPTRVPGTTGVNVQFRAWDNNNGQVTSWAQVMASGFSVPFGSSEVFTIGPLGGAFNGNIFTVPSTTGARSFSFVHVPEPGVIAFGALGLGALLLRRKNHEP